MSDLSAAWGAPPAPVSRRGKRLFDLTLILLALPALLPILAGVSLAVKLGSRGPVFRVQDRVGLGGRRFGMLAFRTRAVSGDALRGFGREGAPPMTPVGRFLRQTALDDLPQILNVLRGDMSLVGPRPARPEDIAQYSPRAMQRFNGLPGLTGAWQLSGHAETGFDEMIEMDLAYLARAGIRADLGLLWRTFRAATAPLGLR